MANFGLADEGKHDEVVAITGDKQVTSWVSHETPSRRRGVALALAILMIALAWISPGALANDKFSIFDEATHLDNAWRYSRIDIPRVGHQISPEILSEWSCRGFYDSSVPFPECAGPDEIVDASFPFSISNYNTKHPPLYYAINGVVARVVVAVTPVDSFVTAARLANALWLALTIVMALWIGTLLQLRRWHSVVLAGVAVSVPSALTGWFYVNNDVGSYASAWAVAAALLYAHQVGLDRGYRPLVVTSVLACLTKGFTIGAVLVVSVILLLGVRDTGIRSSAGRVLFRRVVGLNAAAAASVVGWIAFNRTVKTDIPYVSPIVRPPLERIPWAKISDQIIRVEFPGGSLFGWMRYENGFFDQAVQLWLRGSVWFLAAAPLALALGLQHTSAARFSRNIGFGALLGPPMVATMIILFNLLDGSPGYIRVIDRYHLAVVPFYVLALGVALRGRRYVEPLLFGTFAAGSALVMGAYVAGIL